MSQAYAAATVSPGDAGPMDWPLWEALLQLPKRQRAAIVLRYWLDQSEAQMAAALDCPPGTVKSHLWRGLMTMRKVLDDG